MRQKFLKLISIGLILFLLLSSMGFTFDGSSAIGQNISISGVDVSGMTRTEALTKLKNAYEKQLEDSYILLKYGTILWKMDYKDIAATYNYSKAIDNAFSIVREVKNTSGSAVTTGGTSVTTDSSIAPDYKNINIALTLSYNKKNITDYLSKLSERINIAPRNAMMKISGRNFTIIDGKKGSALDIDDASTKIFKAIQSSSKKPIILTTVQVAPKYNRNNLLDIKDKLGEYTTYFNAKDEDRVTNLKVASNNINNFIVMPNEIFSVNKTIGPRLEENGFKLAHVIVNNKFVDGIGGGVCQVSTTLYNAVLLANLKIVERNHHSIPSTYVPLGRDATISGNSKDFKFQNNTKYPIYITNEVDGSHIKFTIYGKNDYPKRKVKIKTEIISVTRPTTKLVDDPTLPKGTIVVDTKPFSAYTVESYRDVYENGKLLYEEKLFTDKYPLINGIKKVGTKTNL